MARTTSGVETTGTQSGSGVNYSLLIKAFIAIIVIAAGVILVNSLSGNDAGNDQKIPDKTDIDPVSGGVPVAGGVAGAGIVAGEEVSDDTSEEVSEEIGYTEIDYPIDNIPDIIVPPSHRENLKNFQILNLRYENGKLKFCIKDSTTAHSGYGPKILLIANDYSIQRFPINVPKNEMVCHETLYAIEKPEYISVKILG